MKDLKTLIKDVERDMVIGIVVSVKHKRLTLKESEKIAKEFIEYKYETYDDLFKNLFEMGKKYKSVRKIYVKYAPEFEYMKKERDLKIMRGYIEERDYESAIEFAKGLP